MSRLRSGKELGPLQVDVGPRLGMGCCGCRSFEGSGLDVEVVWCCLGCSCRRRALRILYIATDDEET